MTIDGSFDHTAGIADDELHEHYSELLKTSSTILYGRITYQLMQYWQNVLKNPTGIKAMDDFAVTIDRIPKIVFSHTLKHTDWPTAQLATRNLKDEIVALRQQKSGDILVGSPSLIIECLNLNLVDEFQLCVHPVIQGQGEMLLFKNITGRMNCKLVKTKTFASGALVLYYEPVKNS
jgi:dihydrofolate reductase